jgi:hypothetical protein
MGGNSIVIATFNDENERHERVLSLREVNGKSYIAANHWPRAWYRQALDNPNIEIKMAGVREFAPYTAVPLEGAEDNLLREEYNISFRAAPKWDFLLVIFYGLILTDKNRVFLSSHELNSPLVILPKLSELPMRCFSCGSTNQSQIKNLYGYDVCDSCEQTLNLYKDHTIRKHIASYEKCIIELNSISCF